MNPNNSDFIYMIWLKLSKVWRQLDLSIEMIIQHTIEELEEIHQQK